MKQKEWLLCPVCGNKTRLKLRADTVLEKYFTFAKDVAADDRGEMFLFECKVHS